MSRNNKKFVLYSLIFLLPLFLLFTRSEIFAPLKSQIVDQSAGFIRFISSPFWEIKKILYYHRIFEEYKKLKKETDILKARLIGLEEVIRENSRLQQLLDFKRRLVYSSIGANVIGRDPSNWNSSMIIDKGKKDGIAVGMPVVNPTGVVGKIAEVSDRTSKVILVNDPNFSVPALVQRPRETGLLEGTLQGICRMRYLSANAAIEKGDKVITSGLSSSFPEGVLIGEVAGVQYNPNTSTLECMVQPAITLSQIEEVLVIQK